MKIVPYKAEHLLAIRLQPGQESLARYVTPEHAKALESTSAYTVLIDDVPMACGGLLKHWEGRFEAWSCLSDEIKPRRFLAIHQAVARFFDAHPAVRIEAYVDYRFQEGHRWVKLLGFKKEANRLRNYFPDGRDATLYARTK